MKYTKDNIVGLTVTTHLNNTYRIDSLSRKGLKWTNTINNVQSGYSSYDRLLTHIETGHWTLKQEDIYEIY